MPALAQDLGDGDSRKEMPARAAACNHRIHIDCDLRLVGGSVAPLRAVGSSELEARAMLKMMRLRRVLTSSSPPDESVRPADKGLLDPPSFAAFIPVLVDLPVKFAASFAPEAMCVSCWPVPKRPGDKCLTTAQPRTDTRPDWSRHS